MAGLKTRLQSGFTIVEVMIVLAIAGVIMATAFLAVPDLQRNSRDSQRQSVLETVRSELEAYSANNTGKYPLSYVGPKYDCGHTANGDFADFYCNYIWDTAKGIHYKDDSDPTSKNSVFGGSNPSNPNLYVPVQCGTTTVGQACADGTKPTTTGQAQLIVHAKCDGSQAISTDGLVDPPSTKTVTTRSYALVIALERSGSFFCVDNS